MKVPVLDLKRQYSSLKHELDAAVLSVLESQYFILGPEVEALEKEIAAFCGAKCAVGCSSGSDALILALMGMGIGPGDEVITTPFTFFATAGSIAHLGAVPVFVDINPRTFNIDPAQIEKRITKKTKAILPVHLYGQCADMDPINAIARKRGLKVIEDACQAIGAEYKGKKAGSLGDMGCFSFYPTKNLNGMGDGGMVTTNNEELGEKIRLLRTHGAKPKYFHAMVGINARLDAIQAAGLRVKLKHLNDWNDRRREIAAMYDAKMSVNGITTPYVEGFNTPVYHQYVIRTQDRDGLIAALDKAEIGHMIYYPLPLHLQGCFANQGHKEGDFPHAERACKEVLALPIFPEMTQKEIAHVAETVASFAAGKA
ncbi:MAG: DegT/DnrJ/EryC1/StrS family aminotransferase [Planctomycetota bacterium]